MVTARCADPSVVFMGGAEEVITTVGDDGRGRTRRTPRRLGEPPVLAMASNAAAHQIAVSHGTSCRVKTFRLEAEGTLGLWLGYFKKAPACLSVAYESGGRRLALGLANGQVIVVSSQSGAGPFPEEMRQLSAWKASDTAVVGVGFCGDSSDVVSCGRDGTVARYSAMDGSLRWERSLESIGRTPNEK
jgi:hypothetical protein